MIYVKHLPKNITSDSLKDIFEPFGKGENKQKDSRKGGGLALLKVCISHPLLASTLAPFPLPPIHLGPQVSYAYVAYEPDQSDKSQRFVTGYGCLSFLNEEESDMAVSSGNCIEIGREKLLCQRKIFPTIEHHRAIYWGENAETPCSGSVKPYLAAKMKLNKEDDERPRKKSRWGKV